MIIMMCSQEMRLTDGAGAKPAYSLRTLCRALDYARTTAPNYGLQRALYDGFSMAFATQVCVCVCVCVCWRGGFTYAYTHVHFCIQSVRSCVFD